MCVCLCMCRAGWCRVVPLLPSVSVLLLPLVPETVLLLLLFFFFFLPFSLINSLEEGPDFVEKGFIPDRIIFEI